MRLGILHRISAQRTIPRMNDLKLWFAKNFTFKGAALFVIWIAKIVPDMFGRTDFWAKHGGSLWRTVYSHTTLSITLVCALLIWLDHRRVLKKLHGVGADPHSLKGRALDLRKRILVYMKSMPRPAPKPAGAKNYEEAIQWSERITCGFELRFKDELNRLFLQFGELGLLPGFGWLLPEHINTTEKINEIVEDLKKLANIADEKEA